MRELKRIEEFIHENLSWTELNDGPLRIDQVIYVKKDSQEKIIIGKQRSDVTLCAQEEILKRSVRKKPQFRRERYSA
ncbi:2208_t:CDS:2, partial [Ambispora gerdemannii]